MVDAAALKEAAAYKVKGNAAFSKQDFKTAIALYSRALSYNPNDPVFYSNRAACQLKLKEWKRAEEDCSLALAIADSGDSVIVKVLWRRGVARRELENLKDARMDLERALKIEPNNKAVQEELNALIWDEKKIQRNLKSSAKRNQSSQPKSAISPASEVETISKQRNITVKHVDELPERFREEELTRKRSGLPIGSASVASKILLPETPSLYDLTSLLRRPKSDLPEIYNYLFNRLKMDSLPSIFGRGGVETDFLEVFLDCIIYFGENDSNNLASSHFLTQAAEILINLSRCNRFSIARIFVAESKVTNTKKICSKISSSCDDKVAVAKLQTALNMW
ncbi:hypothetical protein V1511DRAFT_499497 [Dipodascopsis uninucleata]